MEKLKLLKKSKPWKIILAQTGNETQTAGRIKKIRSFLKPNEDFFMTYGDGLSDINLKNITFIKNKKLATLTAVKPLARFGALELTKNGMVEKFIEKPINESGWINGVSLYYLKRQ